MPSKNPEGTSSQSRRTMFSKSASRIRARSWDLGAGSQCPGLLAPRSELLPDVAGDLIQPHPILLHRVPVPDCDGACRQGIAINCDPERRARLVHAAVPPPDSAAVIVEAGDLLP